MNKQEIIEKLNENYNRVHWLYCSHGGSRILFSKDDKWSPGPAGRAYSQINKTCKVRVLIAQNLFSGMLFGKSNRPSKTIEGLSIKIQA